MTYTFSDNGTKTVGVTKGTEFTVAASGTFGSGTLAVNYSVDGGWITYASGDTGSFTEADERIFENVGDTDEIQLVLSGATDPSLNVVVNSKRF